MLMMLVIIDLLIIMRRHASSHATIMLRYAIMFTLCRCLRRARDATLPPAESLRHWLHIAFHAL